MVARHTRNERYLGLLILLALSACGIALAALGRDDPLGVHGLIVLLSSLGLTALVLNDFYAPEPDPARLSQYYDDPTRAGIVLSMAWAVFGMSLGVWVAAQLA